MKRFSILVAIIFIASVAWAQMIPTQKKYVGSMKASTNMRIDKGSQKIKKATKDGEPIWSCDFEGDGEPTWTFGHSDEATATGDWQVGGINEYNENTCFYDPAPDGNPAHDLYYLWPMSRTSEDDSYSFGVVSSNTPTKWAFVDALYPAVRDNTFGYKFNSWIEFANLDFSSVNMPMLIFNQVWKKVQPTFTYVDVSNDGGATWKTYEINEGAEMNKYYISQKTQLLPPAAHQSNVSIRFRVENDNSRHPNAAFGYGWEIDDIEVVEAPTKDLQMMHAVTNFFQYYNYVENPDGFAPDVDCGYNKWSYYGNVPEWCYNAPIAGEEGFPHAFNVCVKNIGGETIAPKIDIKVYDPNGEEIHSTSKIGPELATLDIDTIDFIEDDEALFIRQNPTKGTYKIVYKIDLEGDANMENNIDSCFFNITTDLYSRDFEDPYDENSTWTTFSWSDYVDACTDGDMFGTTFWMWDNKSFSSVDIFIAEPHLQGGSEPEGATVSCSIWEPDEAGENMIETARSEQQTITAEMFNSWVTFNFEDPVEITLGEEGLGRPIRVCLAVDAYNGAEVRIGLDDNKYTSSVNFGFTSYDPNDGKWYILGKYGGVGIHLGGESTSTSVAPSAAADEISVYPNPASDVLNISNAEGKDIEIYNVLGSVVKTVNNASSNQQIDLSDFANGTYIVKVNGGAYKFNVVR